MSGLSFSKFKRKRVSKSGKPCSHRSEAGLWSSQQMRLKNTVCDWGCKGLTVWINNEEPSFIRQHRNLTSIRNLTSARAPNQERSDRMSWSQSEFITDWRLLSVDLETPDKGRYSNVYERQRMSLSASQ